MDIQIVQELVCFFFGMCGTVFLRFLAFETDHLNSTGMVSKQLHI